MFWFSGCVFRNPEVYPDQTGIPHSFIIAKAGMAHEITWKENYKNSTGKKLFAGN